MAITSATKEPSTPSLPLPDQPMEFSVFQPPSMDVIGLETVPKELKEIRDGVFHRNSAETVDPSASVTLEKMDISQENKPILSFLSLSSEDKTLKTTVERLAEMVSSSSHSSSLLRGTCHRELAQSQILPSLSDHCSITSITTTTTTHIPLTPKIGMGKPAITKRKFSPGRPRVRQVRAWILGHKTNLDIFTVSTVCQIFCRMFIGFKSNCAL